MLICLWSSLPSSQIYAYLPALYSDPLYFWHPVVRRYCGINQWWGSTYKKKSFGFLLFEWFLNFGHRNHCQNPKIKILCVPHMWHTIPHLWVKVTTYVVNYTTNANSPEIPILFIKRRGTIWEVGYKNSGHGKNCLIPPRNRKSLDCLQI